MEELKLKDKNAEFGYFGGEMMIQHGGKRYKHFSEMAFMGFWNVLKNIDKVRANFIDCENAIKEFKPDLVILVDYPGFNLRMAKFVKKKIHIPVYFFIAPKLWAWKSYRIKHIKKYVDKLLTIFPFETQYFKSFNYDVYYVGNPTVDNLSSARKDKLNEQQFRKKNFLNEKPILALLPGSRKQEIAACLPIMMKAAEKYKDFQVIISGAHGIDISFYYQFMTDDRVPVTMSQTLQLLLHAEFAIVNSGTATLETALAGVPQIVVYRIMMGRFASLLKQIFIKTKYISLVNILARKEVVKELYAHLFTVENIQIEMDRLVNDKMYVEGIKNDYKNIVDQLGNPGTAKRAAEIILADFKI
jgi:lipid-A-disaccharide synthase